MLKFQLSQRELENQQEEVNLDSTRLESVIEREKELEKAEKQYDQRKEQVERRESEVEIQGKECQQASERLQNAEVHVRFLGLYNN